jgi:hypothetical protein
MLFRWFYQAALKLRQTVAARGSFECVERCAKMVQSVDLFRAVSISEVVAKFVNHF